MSKKEEYKELFLAEAQEGYEQLNAFFIQLEKDIRNESAIHAIFRITHTLKGNAMGLGFEAIAALSHVMEDIFGVVRQNKIILDEAMFQALFRANDVLGALIKAEETGEKVRYKGILTKLKVALRKALEAPQKTVAVSSDHESEDVTNTSTPDSDITIETIDTKAAPQITLSNMVQVPIRKLDTLLNMVGELIIEKDRLLTESTTLGFSSSDIARLHRITSDLQYQVMDIRLVQVGFLFQKFHRILRDAANIEGKNVELVLEGTNSEIDRNILKIISDSLVHLVRNAVSHGIESPEERTKNGKSPVGQVKLSAHNQKDVVVIEISDDGAGIDLERVKEKAVSKGLLAKDYAKYISDDELLSFIFESGFSNAQQINEISGRGVGLDAVRSSVESIGGRISIETVAKKGTTFRLSLPSSMAVKGALLFQLDQQDYAIALSCTEAVVSIEKRTVHKMNNSLVTQYLGKAISIVFLRDLFEMKGMSDIGKPGALLQTYKQLEDNAKLEVIVVAHNNHWVGIVVDRLIQQKEIFEKTLSKPLDHLELFSGATILGNGRVCLVLDGVRLISTLFKEQMASKARIIN